MFFSELSDTSHLSIDTKCFSSCILSSIAVTNLISCYFKTSLIFVNKIQSRLKIFSFLLFPGLQPNNTLELACVAVVVSKKLKLIDKSAIFKLHDKKFVNILIVFDFTMRLNLKAVHKYFVTFLHHLSAWPTTKFTQWNCKDSKQTLWSSRSINKLIELQTIREA